MALEDDKNGSDTRRGYQSPTTPLQQHLKVLEKGGRSLRKAVNAKCWECMGGDEDKVSRLVCDEIRNCSSYGCPLRPYRPYQ